MAIHKTCIIVTTAFIFVFWFLEVIDMPTTISAYYILVWAFGYYLEIPGPTYCTGSPINNVVTVPSKISEFLFSQPINPLKLARLEVRGVVLMESFDLVEYLFLAIIIGPVPDPQLAAAGRPDYLVPIHVYLLPLLALPDAGEE